MVETIQTIPIEYDILLKEMGLEENLCSHINQSYEDHLTNNKKIPTAKERILIIINALKISCAWYANNAMLFYFNNKYYKEITEKIFCGLLGNCIEKTHFQMLDLSERKKAYETLHADILFNCEKYEHIIDTQPLIGLQNGIYNWETNEFLPFSNKFYISSLLTKSYDPTKDCPRFKHHLQQSLPKQEDQDLLLSYLAYSLTTSIKFQCSLFLVGTGKNGKSIIPNLMKLLMKKKCASIKFDHIINEARFDNIDQEFATLAVGSEISSEEASPKNCDTYKDQITNPTIKIEHKGFDKYDVDRKIKYLCDVNNFPKVTLANPMPFFRRIRILHFLHTVSLKERILDFDKVLYNEEGDAILTYILSYLPKMEQYLTEQLNTWKESQEKWESCVDPTRTFLDNFVSIGDKEISFKELYQIYMRYMQYYGFDPKKTNALSRQLKANAFEMFRKSNGIYYNITIAQEIYDLLNYLETTEEEKKIEEENQKKIQLQEKIIEINEEE
jgi:putative DNA primase/helicase